MNKKQLYILALGFIIIGNVFLFLDTDGVRCWDVYSEPFDAYDAYCIMSSEMHEPFIYMFHLLFVLFVVLAWQTEDRI